VLGRDLPTPGYNICWKGVEGGRNSSGEGTIVKRASGQAPQTSESGAEMLVPS
jgi:hypothetical protein